MRPYRGLTKDGKWVYGWYLPYEKTAVIIPSEYLSDDTRVAINCYENAYAEILADAVEVIPETVGQQIGLYWEDDILESQDGLRRFVVTYNAKQCNWYLKGIHKAWSIQNPVWSIHKHIGNIHENPELLEKNK